MSSEHRHAENSLGARSHRIVEEPSELGYFGNSRVSVPVTGAHNSLGC